MKWLEVYDKYSDDVYSVLYSLGQALTFFMWVTVAFFILRSMGIDLSGLSYGLALMLGTLGNAMYGMKSYEKKLR